MRCSFHGNCLYSATVWTMKPKPELLSHNPNGISVNRPAGLFQSKRIILPVLLVFRWLLTGPGLCLTPVKECLIASIEPFNDILHSLGTEILPLRVLITAEPCDKNLHPVGRNVFSIDTVIPFLQCKTVIPNLTGNFNFGVKVFSFLCPIQLILIGTSYC